MKGDKDENTIQTIADTYNISTGTVLRIARQFSLPRRSELRRERDADVIARLKAKRTLEEIAREFTISVSRVSQIAKKANLNRYGVGGTAPWRSKVDKIIAAYKRGDKTDAIEAEFKIDRHNLYRLLRANKVQANRRPR
jgi:hypothetical protein